MAPRLRNRLAVWMNGDLVGHWTLTPSGHQLEYETSWVQSPAGRALSLSLPFTAGNAPHRGETVRHYFENLLPDRPEIRNRLRDCVGAVQLLPEGVSPENLRTIQGEPLDERSIERALALAEGSLENEWLCARILSAYGLPVASSELARFGDQRVLVVERFDRRLSADGRWWLRLPVEDLCQAEGLPPEKKNESDGGPGIGSVLGLQMVRHSGKQTG